MPAYSLSLLLCSDVVSVVDVKQCRATTAEVDIIAMQGLSASLTGGCIRYRLQQASIRRALKGA
jgi:hypothetical protein